MTKIVYVVIVWSGTDAHEETPVAAFRSRAKAELAEAEIRRRDREEFLARSDADKVLPARRVRIADVPLMPEDVC